ncbi:MAG: biopolymer transporter ExbD [Acidobacteriota bacterium]|nr:biopolymer transporter ExbD [Acidobacteriota bacterium]
MAIHVGGMNGGRRSRGAPVLAEINVTPFVDVALVLLIIFMITAHAMDSGIDVNVPKTKTVATSTRDLPIVTITKDGEVYLGKDAVNINTLGSAIRSKYPGQSAVYVKADAATPWDPIANVTSVLGDQKLNVSFVTRPSDEAGKRR